MKIRIRKGNHENSNRLVVDDGLYMNHNKWIGHVLAALVLFGAPLTSSAALSCTITQLGFGKHPSISADGSRVAFVSSYGFDSKLSLLDLQANTLVDVTNEDAYTGPYWSPPPEPFLSGDGTRAAFQSRADFTGGNATEHVEVFLADIRTRSMRQVTDAAEDYTSGFSSVRAINADGSRIVFATNITLAGEGTKDGKGLFLYDTDTRAYRYFPGTSKTDSWVSISADGGRVAFMSSANLAGRNQDRGPEIFLLDTNTNKYTQITSVTHNVGQSQYSSYSRDASISADGRRVAFQTNTDLTGNDADGNFEIFVYETATKAIAQVTDTTSESWSVYSDHGSLSINADGARIAFRSAANLTGHNADGNYDLFLLEVNTGNITQVTDTIGGHNIGQSINADGARIVFSSLADLTGGNPGDRFAVFLADCQPALASEPLPEPEPEPQPEPEPEPVTGPNTEILRSFRVRSGSGFVTAGTGLVTQAGGLNVKVPAAAVRQVILYWAGRGTGDDSIVVDGNPVTGDLIGGPSRDLDNPSLTYRADITNLGLIGAGVNRLIVEGLDVGAGGYARNNGAGVVVIFKEARRANAAIRLRDGNDFASSQAMPPLNSTRAQTFRFKPANRARTARLSLFVTDAAARSADVVVITVGNKTRRVVDRLKNRDGAYWDTLNLAIRIPAGVASVKVQILSARDATSRLQSTDSLAWVAVVLNVPGR